MSKKANLTEGHPGRILLLFALPMIVGNLFQQLYNMADAAIVGNYIGEEALAAVGASYSYTTVFIMIAIGGGIGASVLVSQYLGAGQYRQMRTAISTFLITFLVFSTLLASASFLLNPMILSALDTPPVVYDQAVHYLQIYSAGLPFMFMYNVLSANFNALGKSYIPLCLLIFSSVLNVVLDLLMVGTFHFGVGGAAAATVIAQGISVVISFGVFLAVLRNYTYEGKAALFDGKMLSKGMRVAVPSIIQQSIVSIGMLLTQSAVNRFGAPALAGYSAGMRLESLCVVPMIATGNAVSTFTAQNIGAGQIDRVREGYRKALLIVLSFGAFLLLMSQCLYRPAISLFVDAEQSAEAFATGTACFRFEGCFFAIIGFKAVTDGVLRGSGDVRIYMVANLVNLAIRVLIARLLSPVLGLHMVWFAVPIGWLVNFIISFCRYRTGRWMQKRMV